MRINGRNVIKPYFVALYDSAPKNHYVFAPHLLDKIGDYLHHYNLEDRRPVHAKKDQMKKAESYW